MAGVEQPFGCFTVHGRHSVQPIRRSVVWTWEDNLVDGLFFCATSGGYLGHSSPKFSKYWIAILTFLQKRSRNKDEILYSDRFKEKTKLNFSLYYWLIISLINLEIRHLIENFVNDWYFNKKRAGIENVRIPTL